MGENSYRRLKDQNILRLLQPLIQKKAYVVRKSDGKLKIPDTAQIAINTPWIFNGAGFGYDCYYWTKVIFNTLSKNVKGRFVPRHCQNCWKVVVKPRTLEQLFALLELQQKSGLHSKCGIELRDSVPGLYGGYFWNRGKEAGLRCYDTVLDLMKTNKILSPLLDEVDNNDKTTRIILKRGCTEMEHACGPSDKWEITPAQNALEDLAATFVVQDTENLTQQDHLIWDVQQRWIEWAWKNGDPTYALYTDGEPLYPAYVIYHPTVKSIEERNLKQKLTGDESNGNI